MSTKRKIQIKSENGSAVDTKVIVDGMDLDIKSLRIEVDAEGVALATFQVYVDEIDIDTEFLTTLDGVKLQR